ncbi:ribonuclease P protein component [Larkinella soli]|uniref:ribonuclease P protein component n=1 Tax=Larkinella soli TaxID=1770527 RepID=UPI000FFBA10D|nr:ribonuclease P protein component [Larkinella soli]
MKQTFKKSERLCSKKITERLFERGSASVRTFYLFPFRILYIADPDPGDPAEREPVASGDPADRHWPAVLISISRRNFKKAVDRNFIRRRVREAYRQNKPLLLGPDENPRNPPAYIAFLYTAREKISFEEIEKSVKLALGKIAP